MGRVDLDDETQAAVDEMAAETGETPAAVIARIFKKLKEQGKGGTVT